MASASNKRLRYLSTYIVDRKNDDPQQFRAPDHGVESYKASKKAMRKTSKKVSADAIEEKASRGEDLSNYFSNEFTVVRPIRRVSVDLTPGMLRRVDEVST